MDYRLLLLKYMAHVGWLEGVDYAGPADRGTGLPADHFTDEEWAELRRLSEEGIRAQSQSS